MTSKEALNLLSIMKLGVDLGAFPEDRRLPIDELFIDTQPAHLQKSSQQKLNAEERDSLARPNHPRAFESLSQT